MKIKRIEQHLTNTRSRTTHTQVGPAQAVRRSGRARKMNQNLGSFHTPVYGRVDRKYVEQVCGRQEGRDGKWLDGCVVCARVHARQDGRGPGGPTRPIISITPPTGRVTYRVKYLNSTATEWVGAGAVSAQVVQEYEAHLAAAGVVGNTDAIYRILGPPEHDKGDDMVPADDGDEPDDPPPVPAACAAGGGELSQATTADPASQARCCFGDGFIGSALVDNMSKEGGYYISNATRYG